MTVSVDTTAAASKPIFALDTTDPLRRVALATVTTVDFTSVPRNITLFPPDDVTVEEDRIDTVVLVMSVPLSSQFDPAVLKSALERI